MGIGTLSRPPTNEDNAKYKVYIYSCFTFLAAFCPLVVSVVFNVSNQPNWVFIASLFLSRCCCHCPVLLLSRYVSYSTCMQQPLPSAVSLGCLVHVAVGNAVLVLLSSVVSPLEITHDKNWIIFNAPCKTLWPSTILQRIVPSTWNVLYNRRFLFALKRCWTMINELRWMTANQHKCIIVAASLLLL